MIFHWFNQHVYDWPNVLKVALIISAVIFFEGLITLDIFQLIDPLRSKINFRKEIFLLGLGNVFAGLLGGLPIMPVLVRSTANVEFGAKTRWSVLLQALWLLLASIFFMKYLGLIPMASIASVLLLIGLNLIDLKFASNLFQKGASKFIPFLATALIITFVDLLTGIFVGFVVGLIFTLISSTKRSMVLVNDGNRYLLKFFKDVTPFNKAELKDTLDSIPDGNEVLIDGTGNIFVDSEIEDWLADYASRTGENVKFVKSKLAISTLFKE